MKTTKKPTTITLAHWIIDKANTDAYRAGTLSGTKHPKADGELLEKLGGRANLVEQAKILEKQTDAGRTGKIWFKWTNVNTDISVIHFDIDSIPELCEIERIEDPRARQQRLIRFVSQYREEVKECDWICQYYDDILENLKSGKREPDAYKEDEKLFCCVNAIANLKESMWEHVFSRRVFGDSKKFQNEYRSKIFTILKKYSPYYENELDAETADKEDAEKEEIDKRELLQMHGIMSYAQTMEWKGNLTYYLDTAPDVMIQTASNLYGTVLNTQTLEHAIPADLSFCRKIMTIENKANYESLPYEEGTLYIFCHGHFTPKEAVFLKKIHEIAPKGCEYYHWSDMDLGGISIFQSIKNRIFPELKPYKMSVADYREAIEHGAGLPLKASSRKKLLRKEAGVLEDLRQEILKRNQIVEQEYFL